jgi:hypothetical protein
MNEMPIFWHQSEVNIMWQESREWMKFGGNAFFCFIVFGFLHGIIQKGGQQFSSVPRTIEIACN